MIDNPIEIQTYDWFSEFCYKNIGKALLFGSRYGRNPKYVSYIRIDKDPDDETKYINFWLFRAERWQNSERLEFSYIFDDEDCSREHFIYGMMERYPDHFEWLLFHPEYLL